MPSLSHVLDPTGTNVNNLVSGEVAVGLGTPNKIIKPEYGPFHVGTQIVVDATTNEELTIGIDYDCVGLVQEATIKFEKPIAEFIKVKNSNTTLFRIQYQPLGGLYQNSNSVLANLWTAYLNDDRPVDYGSKVIDKPFEFPPTLHPTLFKDVTGFEPLITAIERLTQGILISNAPAYQNIVDWVMSMIPTLGSIEDIQNGTGNTSIVTQEVLLHVLNSFIATDAEALAGVIENKAINPKQLKAAEDRANDFAMAMSIALG